MNLKESKPLVSFILTYYNLPIQMLCECIESILALSLRPDEREIIVIDDGSDVSPMNALSQYEDNIIYIRQKNQGVSMARNTGLQMAKGLYIQLIDGDDMLLKVPYEHCLDIIRNHPDADMVLFDFSQSNDVKETRFDTPLKTSGSDYMRNHNIRGAAWCYIFRQSVRSQLAFTKGVAYGEDEEFTPQLLLRAETIFVTSAKAYFYRKHEGSAINQESAESKERRLTDNRYVILRLHDLCDKLPQQDRLALQRRVAQLTMAHIYNTIRLSHSRQALNDCLDDLRKKGLFPLPDRDYTQKYKWFRKMTNSAIGRTILFETLPLLKKER